MTAEEKLAKIRQRLDRVWADDADKWEADTHAACEDIDSILYEI